MMMSQRELLANINGAAHIPLHLVWVAEHSAGAGNEVELFCKYREQIFWTSQFQQIMIREDNWHFLCPHEMMAHPSVALREQPELKTVSNPISNIIDQLLTN